jgi:hypothetical protein
MLRFLLSCLGKGKWKKKEIDFSLEETTKRIHRQIEEKAKQTSLDKATLSNSANDAKSTV